VAIADSDDLLLPDWLASQVAYMDAHPDVHICGCQLESFSHETGKPRGRTNHPPVVTPEVVQAQADAGQIWFINHGGSIYRRDAVLALGGYNPTLRRGQDFDLWMRAHRAGLVIHNQPDVLYRYRRGHQ
jgi:cellulose synthase/poly-beta-1,6-N-acetylglucosamine synthase-like glycosyltransferase